MTVKTHLVSGAGNTFHISYGDRQKLNRTQMKAIAQKICLSTPADGFIFLHKEKNKNDSYSWDFFNNDGSDAEMCGNATRCVGYYIKEITLSKSSQWLLQTTAGEIQINQVKPGQFKILMIPIKKDTSSLGFYCDTGVPHLVLEKKQIVMDEKSKLEARALRNHPSFSPKGTNVTYVVLDQPDNKIRAVSYERGVEDFTAACGTGAMAAAFFNLTKRSTMKTEVEMPGGTLMMDLSDINNPTMTGPAVLLGSFEHEISI